MEKSSRRWFQDMTSLKASVFLISPTIGKYSEVQRKLAVRFPRGEDQEFVSAK